MECPIPPPLYQASSPQYVKPTLFPNLTVFGWAEMAGCSGLLVSSQGDLEGAEVGIDMSDSMRQLIQSCVFGGLSSEFG